MDADETGEARERVQKALSRARLTDDPDLKEQWQRLADAWLVRLAELEGKPPPAPRKPPPVVVGDR